MRADNSPFIVEAAKERRDAALRWAYEAIGRLDRAGEPVTFANVAAATSVSRAWLYRRPHIRAEIDRLRVARRRSSRPVPSVAQRGSEESRQGRIEALFENNKRLREECRGLRDQVPVCLASGAWPVSGGGPERQDSPATCWSLPLPFEPVQDKHQQQARSAEEDRLRLYVRR